MASGQVSGARSPSESRSASIVHERCLRRLPAEKTPPPVFFIALLLISNLDRLVTGEKAFQSTPRTRMQSECGLRGLPINEPHAVRYTAG